MAVLISFLSRLRSCVPSRNLLSNAEAVFRHCFFPVHFNSKPAFVKEKCFRLEINADGALETSVACERFAPEVQYVHAYGCRLVNRINARDQAAGKFKAEKRKIYCGAYSLSVGAIRGLAGAEMLTEVISADVVHQAEAGEIAHAAVLIKLDPSSAVGVEGTKTAIIDRLWNASSGPMTHTCECDKDQVAHPGAKLGEGPAGPYIDQRSRIKRLWHLARCLVESRLMEQPPPSKAEVG